MKARRHELLEKKATPNVVYICAFLVLLLYFSIGRLAVAKRFAATVPLIWKCVAFAAMFASVWYSDLRINRRMLDATGPRLPRLWFVWVGIVSFGFAVISADQVLLFVPCSLLTVLYMKGADRYWDHKLAQVGGAGPANEAVGRTGAPRLGSGPHGEL